MDSKNRIMIFAAIVLYLFLHFPSQTEAGVELATPNEKAIAEKALEIARKVSVDTGVFFTGLAQTNPAHKTALEQCATNFKEAVQFLNLLGLQGGTASLDVHYGLDEVNQCQDALTSGHVQIDSATSTIQKWKTVYDAADATVATLEN
ncbi:hypothetical protein H0E87_023091 [Populus deltoides]|uniref:Pectinesterase inhibitor domain-containing protein n=1 Tax=Populus deltoides TaxID=3696 RepID=A0A8T2XDS7_POPDE|nr:hypothetical protein H0E87_023091 [Populus deltoides]